MNVSFEVPEDVWRKVVLNRWRLLCPQCFDIEAEQACVAYEFGKLQSETWSQRKQYEGTGRGGDSEQFEHEEQHGV
jgi:hypothetical protein